MKPTDEDLVRRRYPTKWAREAADSAVNALPMTTTLAEATDAWVAAYRAAGGLER